MKESRNDMITTFRGIELILLLLLFFEFPNSSFSQNNELAISISVKNDSLSLGKKFAIHVRNGTNDTLLNILNPILLLGIQQNEEIYFPSNVNPEYNYPNAIFLTPYQSGIKFDYDGSFQLYYNEFPKILVLPPNEEKEIVVCVPEEDEIFVFNKSWRYLGLLNYGFKKELDSLIREDSTLTKEYELSLEDNEVSYVNAIKFSELINVYNKLNENENALRISKILWSVFRFISHNGVFSKF